MSLDWRDLAYEGRFSEAADELKRLVDEFPDGHPVTRGVYTLRVAEYQRRAGHYARAIETLETIADPGTSWGREAIAQLALMRNTVLPDPPPTIDLSDHPEQSEARRAWDAVRKWSLQVYPRDTDFAVWCAAPGARMDMLGTPDPDPVAAVLSAAEELRRGERA